MKNPTTWTIAAVSLCIGVVGTTWLDGVKDAHATPKRQCTWTYITDRAVPNLPGHAPANKSSAAKRRMRGAHRQAEAAKRKWKQLGAAGWQLKTVLTTEWGPTYMFELCNG